MPSAQTVKCGVKSERKKIRRKRGRSGKGMHSFTLSPYPTPLLFFFLLTSVYPISTIGTPGTGCYTVHVHASLDCWAKLLLLGNALEDVFNLNKVSVKVNSRSDGIDY